MLPMLHVPTNYVMRNMLLTGAVIMTANQLCNGQRNWRRTKQLHLTELPLQLTRVWIGSYPRGVLEKPVCVDRRGSSIYSFPSLLYRCWYALVSYLMQDQPRRFVSEISSVAYSQSSKKVRAHLLERARVFTPPPAPQLSSSVVR